MYRRHFLGAAAASVTAALAWPHRLTAQRPPAVKPKRLTTGDTVALVAPASATFNTLDLQIAQESLEALGLKVKVGGHLLDRHGYLAGQDRDRAGDINRVFADPDDTRGPADSGRLGQQPAAAVPRLRPHSPEPEDRPRLQRHHGAPAQHPRAHRLDHVSRTQRHGPLGRVLGGLGQADPLRRRGGGDGEPARER